MSTYTHSRYRTARKGHECASCKAPIQPGERYLDFKPGLHSSVKVCSACSVKVRRGDGSIIFWCRAVEEELAHRKAQASAQGPHDDERSVSVSDEIGLVRGTQESQR